MIYEFSGDTVTIDGAEGFSIGQILECGQCFRFAAVDTEDGAEYVLSARNKVLHVRQSGRAVSFFPTYPEEFENIWENYFDLDTDYEQIKRALSDKDDYVRDAAGRFGGIRILNQEPWECLISFIISQNNMIPRIKKVLANITQAFGEPIADGFYTFPAPERLASAGLEEIAACRTGFRDKYILDAAQKVSSGEISLDALSSLSSARAREALMTIKGVGPKVADCVMLFSMNKKDTFPTDVWIKRVMQRFYFDDKEESLKAIHEFARERFGEYAGVAQEYLFAYARERQIGGKKEQVKGKK
ncbi:MAG: DNA-3-methyladenine glycosylase [Defluviitaleaceae bacterium]|nr:DNA-3-methyladenine glycosylase [Defluviitaleaceae bacterium]